MSTYRSYQAFLDAFEERGWTDGLPVAPPSAARVERLLQAADLDGKHALDPGTAAVTAERVAVAAALAGCRPELMPVVVAGVRAGLAAERAAAGLPGSTDAARCLIVHGPLAAQLGVRSGPQCMGPGWPANAGIGRAVNLALASADRAERPTPAFSSPDAYSFCFGEDADGGPWEPLHVERGLAPEQSAVTLQPVLASLPSEDRSSRTPEGVVDSLARRLRSRPALAGRWPELPLYFTLVVGLEQQRVFAEAGWSRSRLREALWSRLSDPAREGALPRLGAPEEVPVVSAGGPGMSWIWLLVAPGRPALTRAIEARRKRA